jgi:hypothetical protein
MSAGEQRRAVRARRKPHDGRNSPLAGWNGRGAFFILRAAAGRGRSLDPLPAGAHDLWAERACPAISSRSPIRPLGLLQQGAFLCRYAFCAGVPAMQQTTPYCIAKASSSKARKSKGWEACFQIGFLHRDHRMSARGIRSRLNAPSINVQGQRGALATTTFTRGVNLSVGGGSVATQRIQNLTTR